MISLTVFDSTYYGYCRRIFFWLGNNSHDLVTYIHRLREHRDTPDNNNGDVAIDVHRQFAEVPTTKSTMHLYPVDGAVHRVDDDETAWAHRDATWSMVITGVDSDPANQELITDWATEYWEAIHPHSAGGSYINFMMEEGQDRIRATYGDNYDRLQQIKATYDPENFFRVNQNIEPAG